jgi:hypothetical protein
LAFLRERKGGGRGLLGRVNWIGNVMGGGCRGERKWREVWGEGWEGEGVGDQALEAIDHKL